MAMAARRRTRAALSVVAAERGDGRLRLRRVGTASLARVALAVQLVVTAAVLGVVAVLYVLLWAVGLLSRLEHLIQSLFGFSSFRFLPLSLFLGLAVTGLALSLLGTGLAVLAAAAYNLVAAKTGGVEVDTGESPRHRGTPRPLV